MKYTNLKFLFEYNESYHTFFGKISTYKMNEPLHAFIKNTKGCSDFFIHLKDDKIKGNSKKVFITNLIHLYRYLISAIAHNFSIEERINYYILIKKILCDDIKEVKELKNEITWTRFFPSKSCLLTPKYIEDLNDIIKTSKNQSQQYNKIINDFIFFHLSISELFGVIRINKINEPVGDIINNYIDYINGNSELEQIFGVTIENDMKIIYEGLNK